MLVNSRLTWCTEHNNLITQSQTGFRKGLSCVDNLRLKVYIEEALLEKNDLPAAFLDVSAAFPIVNN